LHKAAHDKQNQSTWKACDDTGLMGCCCRHNAAIYMANITGGGEKRKYPLAIMDQILKDVDPEWEVRVLCGIGCTLKNFLSLVCLMCLGFSNVSSYQDIFTDITVLCHSANFFLRHQTDFISERLSFTHTCTTGSASWSLAHVSMMGGYFWMAKGWNDFGRTYQRLSALCDICQP
jgi:hypothetical protein